MASIQFFSLYPTHRNPSSAASRAFTPRLTPVPGKVNPAFHDIDAPRSNKKEGPEKTLINFPLWGAPLSEVISHAD
jgi:hypothetical protein